jgi:sugar lactone lactonase YvrE
LSGDFIYIVDTSIGGLTPAIIVYSISLQQSVRVLSGHASMYGSSIHLDVSGTQVKFGPFGLRINADTLVLDRTGTTLYYGALTHNKLYSISTSHLLFYFNKYMEAPATAEYMNEAIVQFVTEISSIKPITDGGSSDNCDNIWLTSIEDSSLAVYHPVPRQVEHRTQDFGDVVTSKQYSLLKVIQNPLLRWPDGLSFGPDGLYITASALHLKFSGKDISADAPYHIFKISSNVLQKHGILNSCGRIMPAAGQ